jgi:hypothetical protein
MPFGLTNTPATFQSHIDDCLWPYIDDFPVCYLDNILIYSANEKEHEEHVYQVLQRLKESSLYCKAEKCQFGVSDVGFLGIVITPDGVGMKSDRISTIEDWPTPKSVTDMDRLRKRGIYLPCQKDIDSPELAWLVFEHVICKRGVPDNIVTDRGTQFTSRFWTRVCSHLSTDHWLLTAFHPQTDGQTESQNQTMEQYLGAFCHYEQDNWVELLPLTESAYNNTIHSSTRMTPFWANSHYHPVMQFKAQK